MTKLKNETYGFGVYFAMGRLCLYHLFPLYFIILNLGFYFAVNTAIHIGILISKRMSLFQNIKLFDKTFSKAWWFSMINFNPFLFLVRMISIYWRLENLWWICAIMLLRYCYSLIWFLTRLKFHLGKSLLWSLLI